MDDKKNLTWDEFILRIKPSLRGEKLVNVVVFTSFILVVPDFFSLILIFGFNFWYFAKVVMWSAVYYYLYVGRPKARSQFVILRVVDLIVPVGIALQMSGEGLNPLHSVLFWYSALSAATGTVFCFLIFTKSVRNYLYPQRIK